MFLLLSILLFVLSWLLLQLFGYYHFRLFGAFFFIYLLTTVLQCGIFSLQTTTLWYIFFCRKDFFIMEWHIVSPEPSIKLLRLRSGLTQSEFAQFLNIPLKTIQSWEQSQRTAPYYVVNLVEFKLSVSFPDIDFSDYYIVKE